MFPQPNATPASPIPPVTPATVEVPSKFTSPTPRGLKATAQLTKTLGMPTETYAAYGATELLYKECALQATYEVPLAKSDVEEMPKTKDGEDLGIGEGWWLTEAALKPTFSTWAQVTMLHMYLLSARLRCFPAGSAQSWQQHLLDHFFYDAENRMTVNHNMHARGTRNKYLKDLFIQWRGLLAAYDEGIVKGDAVLGAAVWRNVFKADEDVNIKTLAEIVSYMRRALRSLDSVSDGRFMQAGLLFGSPKGESLTVGHTSPLINLPFKKAFEEDLPRS